jgi:hypothetical protein
MRTTTLRSIALAVVLAALAVGCGGSVANQSEPAGAVKSALDSAQSGGIAALEGFACAANKDEIANMFGAGGLDSLEGLGVDADDLLGAMKMEFKDIQTTEKSKSGDNAIVNVKGTMTVTIDPAKMREFMKAMMEAQGQPVDDATLDMAIGAMSSQLSQSQPLDEDVEVVQEGGKWLICG